MADKGIKKVVIPKATLPDVSSENEYLVRYRIVSEDRNRVSGWSPVFTLKAKAVSPLNPNNVVYSINNRVISITWEDQEGRERYDIFTKFDGGQYQYHKTVTGNSHTIISQGTTSFQFAIQVPSISKEKSPELEIYQSSVISLV